MLLQYFAASVSGGSTACSPPRENERRQPSNQYWRDLEGARLVAEEHITDGCCESVDQELKR